MHIICQKLTGSDQNYQENYYRIAILQYTIFEAQMFLNSRALSLLQNIFGTRLASMSTSRLICINANAQHPG